MGIFDAFGLLLAAFGDPVQEFKDVVCGDGFDVRFAKILVKPVKERLVRLDRIFFVN